VHFHLDQLVGALKQFRSQDHHGGCAVSHFRILQLSQLYE
jgi:hypothetical protein